MSFDRLANLGNRALLGVDRLKPEAIITGTAADALIAALPADTSIPKRVLLAAGSALAIERAARPASAAPATVEPAPLDDRPELPERAARLVLTLLKAPPALRELGLARIQTLGAVLPPELLPDALSAALDPAGRAALRPLVGARGVWLGSQRPLWSWVRAVVDHQGDDGDIIASAREVFETATTKARGLALKTLVGADPGEALAAVDGTWRADSAAQRSSWLLILARQPSPELTLKLEDVVASDRAASVRTTAQRLLATMPTGPLRQRMLDRAIAAFTLTRASRLNPLSAKVVELEPPTELPADWAADGITTPKKGSLPWSHRSHWLVQVLSVVSPTELADRLGMTLPQLCHRLPADDWWALIAMVHGAANHRDTPATVALLDALEQLQEWSQRYHAVEPLDRLLDQLSQTRLAVLAEDRASGRLTGWLAILERLDERVGDTTWSPGVSQIFCRRCRPLIATPFGTHIQRDWTEVWALAASRLSRAALDHALTWPEWHQRSGAGVRRIYEQLALRQQIEAVLTKVGA